MQSQRVLQRDQEEVVQLLHSKEVLGQCADVEKVRYEDFREEKSGDAGKKGRGMRRKRVWHVKIWVGEREVVVGKGGRSVLEVEIRATGIAVRVLTEERKDVYEGIVTVIVGGLEVSK